MTERLQSLETDVTNCRGRLDELTAGLASRADQEEQLRGRIESLQTNAAARRAQIDLLEKSGWWEQPDSLDGDPSKRRRRRISPS